MATTSSPILITFNGKIYNISNFIPKHPGGEKVLLNIAGAEINTYLSGQKELLGLRHEHSKAAYEILDRYSLCNEHKKDEILDSKDAAFWKVGKLGEEYWDWIHRPYDGSLRLFESDLLEKLTRTRWWEVPLIWIPIALFHLIFSIRTFTENYGLISGSFLALWIFIIGCLSWTLFEYSLHRGIFHWKPNLRSPSQITFHFLLHGLHHKTPMDKERLVFPPAAAAIIVAILYTFYRSIFPYYIFCCFGAGKLFGYVCYDMIHYYLHHGSPKENSNLHYKKAYHQNHHFKDTNSGFGISTMLWDYVFGTLVL